MFFVVFLFLWLCYNRIVVYVWSVGFHEDSWYLQILAFLGQRHFISLLQPGLRELFFLFINIHIAVCDYDVEVSSLDNLYLKIIEFLVLASLRLHVDLFTSQFHMLIHVPFFMTQYGSLFSLSTFAQERNLKTIVDHMHSHKNPEVNIANVHSVCLFVWYIMSACICFLCFSIISFPHFPVFSLFSFCRCGVPLKL